MAYPTLTALLAAARMTQTDVAGVLGVTQSAASRKLAGNRGLRMSERYAIVEALRERTGQTLTIEDVFPREEVED